MERIGAGYLLDLLIDLELEGLIKILVDKEALKAELESQTESIYQDLVEGKADY